MPLRLFFRGAFRLFVESFRRPGDACFVPRVFDVFSAAPGGVSSDFTKASALLAPFSELLAASSATTEGAGACATAEGGVAEDAASSGEGVVRGVETALRAASVGNVAGAAAAALGSPRYKVL